METAAVFEDVFFGVPFGETEIEYFLVADLADAAGFGAEAVNEPGELREHGDLEDSDTLHVAFDPVRVGAVGRNR